MKLIFTSIAGFYLLLSATGFGQGCVAIRPMGGLNNNLSNQFGLLNQGEFLFSTNYQYFKSFRHFRGDVEEHERIELGTQVENKSNAIDFGLTYAVTNRLNLRVNLPLFNVRSFIFIRTLWQLFSRQS